MKRKMKIIFLVLISTISAVDIAIAFDQIKDLTIGECLQNAVKANYDLAAENKKLMEENLVLKAKIENDLAYVMKQFKDKTEWVDVSLADTLSFDENCEYKAHIVLSNPDSLEKSGVFFASVVNAARLSFFTRWNAASYPQMLAHGFIINCASKNSVGLSGIKGEIFEAGIVKKLEKRCAMKTE